MTDSEGQPRAGYHRNWLTIIGAVVVFFGFAGGTILFLVELLAEESPPYLGINYLVFMGLLQPMPHSIG